MISGYRRGPIARATTGVDNRLVPLDAGSRGASSNPPAVSPAYDEHFARH